MSNVKIPDQIRDCLNFVGGVWYQPEDPPKIEVISPYHGRLIGRVSHSSVHEVDQAVQEANEAFLLWKETPLKERAQYLFHLRQLMLEDCDTISHIAAAESGKTFQEAKAGLLKGIEVLEFATSIQNMDQGGLAQVSRGVTCQTQREPLGVVVGIAPFNFPAMVPLWMYPIALALGNCFILKPSEKVPLTSQYIGKLFEKAQFPKGVFSIINGSQQTVESLIEHPLVQAVAFVGSTPVARSIYTKVANHGKRVLALGGAKNCLILAPDADPKLAADGIVSSFTGCAGQRCMAGSVLLAVGETEKLIDGVIAKAKAIKLGENMGAIINQSSLNRIQGEIDRAFQQGANIRLDGRLASPPSEYQGGFWLGPTVIDHAQPDMDCYQKELFGPVLTIVRVPSLKVAMAIENANSFGNATSIFTKSGAVAQYVVESASTGMVGVNIGVPVPREPFSFGGTKDSKYGHGDITGEDGIDFWSNKKKVTVKWESSFDNNWMS